MNSTQLYSGATFLCTAFADRHTGCDTRYRMNITNMVYLEDERLAREARTDTEQRVEHCPDCKAIVIVRIQDEINHGKLRGICRCLCGAVWEVEFAA